MQIKKLNTCVVTVEQSKLSLLRQGVPYLEVVERKRKVKMAR